MTDTPTLSQVTDLASTQLEHITRLLAAVQRILAGHPAHDLIEAIRGQAELLANDIDLLTEGA